MSSKDKVIIGISGNVLYDENGLFSGYERAYLNNDYIQAVARAGAVPYMMPIIHDEELIKEQVKNVDAVILSGGQDVNPLLFGEEPYDKIGATLPERDKFDAIIIKTALELKKPILGICRGIQILNAVCGGTLYQDLSYIDGCYIKHFQATKQYIPTHTVKINKETRLYEVFGDKIITNSFHHMCVKDTAPSFKVAARAKDGVVEAIEKEGDVFVVGVQWHPEMMAGKSEIMQKLFNKFVEEAGK